DGAAPPIISLGMTNHSAQEGGGAVFSGRSRALSSVLIIALLAVEFCFSFRSRGRTESAELFRWRRLDRRDTSERSKARSRILCCGSLNVRTISTSKISRCKQKSIALNELRKF